MKYETFDYILKSAKSVYDKVNKFENDIEKVFGGDSVIMSDMSGQIVDLILDSILIEYNLNSENQDLLYNFFFEVYIDEDEDGIIEVNGKEYDYNSMTLYKIFENEI